MSHLAKLPERGKVPGALVGLPELFRTKEYAAEIKRALKKGYTFDDLAEIFSEKCGVTISARQLKYHYTRAKNLGENKKPGAKPEQTDASKGGVSSAILHQKGAEGEEKANTAATPDSPANDDPKPASFVQGNGTSGTSEIGDLFGERRM
jgi:hypothetical protein